MKKKDKIPQEVEKKNDLSNVQARVDEEDEMGKLIETCSMDTGITDLAHQHDHYLYGTPKKQ